MFAAARRSIRELVWWMVPLCGAVGVACAGSSGGTAQIQLSAAGERGEQIAVEKGCASCHQIGAGSGGGLGPSWVGAWGDDVELSDGRVVVFDEDYVVRSVRDPAHDRRPGSWIEMPRFGPDHLDDEELADLIALFQELAAVES